MWISWKSLKSWRIPLLANQWQSKCRAVTEARTLGEKVQNLPRGRLKSLQRTLSRSSCWFTIRSIQWGSDCSRLRITTHTWSGKASSKAWWSLKQKTRKVINSSWNYLRFRPRLSKTIFHQSLGLHSMRKEIQIRWWVSVGRMSNMHSGSMQMWLTRMRRSLTTRDQELKSIWRRINLRRAIELEAW